MKNTSAQILMMFQKSDQPLSVSDILTVIKVNKTTIYRALDNLVNSALIQDVEFGDGKKRYELKDQKHHHHLICLQCKKVQDVQLEENMEKEEIKIAKNNKFKVVKHNLEFFGYCQNCI